MIWRWQVESAIIRATLPEWKPFLFSKEVFWPLSFDRTIPLKGLLKPRLSAGRLLLAIRILKTLSENDLEIQAAIKDDLKHINILLNDWQSNWGNKINMEIPVRIRQWGQTIKEINSPVGLSNSEYRSQVYVRLILDILNENQNATPELMHNNTLSSQDKILKGYTSPSNFVWDIILKDGFPEEKNWYLYREI